MTMSPVRVERRAGQRFPFLLPLSLRECATGLESAGFTQDLSSRGAFFFTDAPLTEGAEVELTLRMPSEITLGESMRVRCRGHVLRIAPDKTGQARSGVAVRFEGYEYLPESAESSASFGRVAALHPHPDEEKPLSHSAPRP
jgi:PilZ domain